MVKGAPATVVVVRGIGDVGSAVAHHLFREGYAVVLHDDPAPATTRRGMAFADAMFDGSAELDGVRAVRALGLDRLRKMLRDGGAIAVCPGDLDSLLAEAHVPILVDARMRKHAAPEVQRGLAEFTIALGPGLVAGRHADVVVDTSWDRLGGVITTGATLPLAGEPRDIAGHGRNRYLYAPVAGVFRTKAGIGDAVRQGDVIAEIDTTTLAVPLDGVLRGLTHDGVPVAIRTKVVEVDPRGRAGEVHGIGERPRKIADGVLTAISLWRSR